MPISFVFNKRIFVYKVKLVLCIVSYFTIFLFYFLPGIFNKNAFAKMKESAIFINTSRLVTTASKDSVEESSIDNVKEL